MDKQEAVAVLNDIMKSCMLLRYISLQLSNVQPNPKLKSYELHIRNHFDAESWNCLKEVAKKHSLSMKEMGEYVIIYKATS